MVLHLINTHLSVLLFWTLSAVQTAVKCCIAGAEPGLCRRNYAGSGEDFSRSLALTWQLLSHPQCLSSLLFSLAAHCFLHNISLCCSPPWWGMLSWERSSVSHLATRCFPQRHLFPPDPRFALVGRNLGVLVLRGGSALP